MPPLDAFLWACFGSGAAFVVLRDVHLERGGFLPKRFKKLDYLLNRLLLAGVAGGLSVALAPASPIQAVYFGVTAPVVVRAWMEHKRLSTGHRTSLPENASGDGSAAGPNR